jgi:hypothetical protein
MTSRAKFLCAAAFIAIATPAFSQSIEVGRLDDAKAFAPGIDIAGALESEAWQSTPADRAARLLSDLPTDRSNPIVRNMLRRVVLSGLVPPDGADEAFERTRIMAAQELASPEEYARFAARNPVARDPALRVDAYITRGDLAAACDISDAIQQGRGDSYWIRLRAACHDMRDETAAADLSRDILRDRGEEATLVVPSPPEGFWVDFMAMDAAGLDRLMTELAGDPAPAGPPEADSIEESLADTARKDDDIITTEPILDPSPLFTESVPAPTFDLITAMEDPSDHGAARLFILGRDGDAKAVSEFVARATDAGLDPSRVLSRIPAVLDAADMANVNLPLFARYAVVTRDIVLMQALFTSTDDEQMRERLALASDALGGGFYHRELGEGLETALMDEGAGAVQDVLSALALGSNMTETVEALLRDMDAPETTDTDWIAIDYAIDRRARAESLLRFSDMVANRKADDPWTLYRTIRGLRAVGFTDTAEQLAAYEFLRGL